MSSLSLHLVTWNGAKYLPHLFASLREQTMQEWSLVVVDNGSRDDTIAVLEQELSHFRTKLRKEIQVVCNAENRGFAGGHNQAFSIGDFRLPIVQNNQYIQLLNQDTVLAPDYLEKLTAFLDAHPDAAAVQGALCRWDFAGDVRTDTIDTLGLRVRRTRQVVEMWAGEPLTQFCTAVQNCVNASDDDRDCHGLRTGLAMTQHLEVFGVSGALPMYRAAALADVALRVSRTCRGGVHPLPSERQGIKPCPTGGGDATEIFDSSFFSYKEDVDLAYRLRAAGWRAHCVPAARAWHDRTAGVHRTRRQRSAFERRLSWRNHLLMLIANEHPRTFTRDWWQIIGHELGKIAYIIVREPRTLAAAPSLFRLLPGAMRKRRGVMANYRAKVEEVGRWFGETNELRMDTNETNPTK